MRPLTPSTQQPAGDQPVGIPERELVVELELVLVDLLVEDVLVLQVSKVSITNPRQEKLP
jgi:hypothetical protein